MFDSDKLNNINFNCITDFSTKFRSLLVLRTLLFKIRFKVINFHEKKLLR